MKAFILTLLILFGAKAMAGYSSLQCTGAETLGGDPSPWPWGEEAQFPWTSIQGVWSYPEECPDRAYIFRVVVRRGVRAVEVVQYNPFQCQETAIGVGYENVRVVDVRMSNLSDLSETELTLRAFSFKWGAVPYSTILKQFNVVVTLAPAHEWTSRKVHQLQKISEHPRMICY